MRSYKRILSSIQPLLLVFLLWAAPVRADDSQGLTLNLSAIPEYTKKLESVQKIQNEIIILVGCIGKQTDDLMSKNDVLELSLGDKKGQLTYLESQLNKLKSELVGLKSKRDSAEQNKLEALTRAIVRRLLPLSLGSYDKETYDFTIADLEVKDANSYLAKIKDDIEKNRAQCNELIGKIDQTSENIKLLRNTISKLTSLTYSALSLGLDLKLQISDFKKNLEQGNAAHKNLLYIAKLDLISKEVDNLDVQSSNVLNEARSVAHACAAT